MFFVLLNLILLSSERILCSTPLPQENIGTILLLNTSNQNCQSGEINTAVDCAIARQLNTHPTLFPFNINTTIQHIEHGSRKHSIYEKLIEGLTARPNILAIIGPACSDIANIVADVSHFLRIPLISQAPTIPNESGYEFSLLPSVISMTNGVVTLLETFAEWKKVVIITQREEPYIASAASLGDMLRSNNISVTTSVILMSLHEVDLQRLMVSTSRIVILIVDSVYTRAILTKAASTIPFQYPYVWVTLDFYNKWWEHNSSNNQLHDFLSSQGVLSISSLPIYTNCDTTSKHYSTQGQGYDRNASLSTLAFDSVSTLLLAINATHLSQNNKTTRSVEIANAIQQTRFHGLLGEICFQNYMLPTKKFQLLQFKKDQESSTLQLVKVGVIDVGLRKTIFSPVTKETLWKNGTPSDGTPVTQENYPNIILTVAIYTLTSCNILLAICGVLFMLGFRNRRVIRLSSPNLNCLIGIGVIVFNLSAPLFVYPPIPRSIINIFCGIRPWLIAIGYSLCLGTINTKMWRVYYIFRDPNPNVAKKPLKDWHLFCFVILFLLLDILILVFTTTFSSSRQQAINVPDIEHFKNGTTETGIEIQYTVTLCESSYKLYWSAFLFGYKIFIHLIAVSLTFKIKKVQVKVLNDSKEVVLILYLTGLVLAAAIVMTFVFRSYLNIYSGTYAVGICATNTVILCVVFGSKAVALYKDPDGENLFPQSNEIPTGLGTCDEMREIATLQRRLKTLEAQLTFYNEERIAETNVISEVDIEN